MTVTHLQTADKGFIALVSVIIIAAVLIALTFTLSFTGFFARFNVLHSEYKERSIAVAEGCVDTALLNLAQDPSYTPTGPINVGPDPCTIVSIQADSPSSGQTTVKTTANFQGEVTNVQAVVASSDLSLISWLEVAHF